MENTKEQLTLKEKILAKFNTGALESFFMGKWYPVVAAVLVSVGHTFRLEIYMCLIHMILYAMAMVFSPSVRPFIIVLCTFSWQLPLAHSPAGPVWSDHFSSGANPYIFGLCVLIIIATFIYTVIKHKVFCGLSFIKTPLLLSTCILSAAFLLNGAFSPTWELRSLAYGALQAFLFPFVFLVFYKGLKSEKSLEELGLYISFVASVMGIMLAVQMLDLYIPGNPINHYTTVFNESGGIIKERIHLGWATWNPVGILTAILIPLIFYGAMKGRHKWAYFTAACVSYISAVMTMSRNTLIWASAAFAACMICACFVGTKRQKNVYRALSLGGAFVIILFAIVFWDKISVLAAGILSKGFSDNGRFELWTIAAENFKAHPVFGTGAFYFKPPEAQAELFGYTPLFPPMAHQTFLQLLGAMGFVGLTAYLYYRIDTAQLFFKKPTLLKSMLGGSVLILLLGSLIDNFIFNTFTVFLYGISLAVAALIYERQADDEIPEPSISKKTSKRKK